MCVCVCVFSTGFEETLFFMRYKQAAKMVLQESTEDEIADYGDSVCCNIPRGAKSRCCGRGFFIGGLRVRDLCSSREIQLRQNDYLHNRRYLGGGSSYIVLRLVVKLH